LSITPSQKHYETMPLKKSPHTGLLYPFLATNLPIPAPSALTLAAVYEAFKASLKLHCIGSYQLAIRPSFKPVVCPNVAATSENWV
jgi:hypothetical protein